MKKTFMGVRLRRLREERGMTQVALARALDLSASYLNQIEQNQRPLTVPVLLKINAVFGVDVQRFSDDDEARLVAGLRDVLMDTASRQPPADAVSLAEIRELAANMPAVARTLLALHRSRREADERLAALSLLLEGDRPGSTPASWVPAQLPGQPLSSMAPMAPMPPIPPMAYEQVRDFFFARHNHIPALDDAAEQLAGALALPERVSDAPLAQRLLQQHGVRVALLPEPAPGQEGDAALRRFDARERVLHLGASLSPAQRAFQLATQLAFLEMGPVLDQVLEQTQPGAGLNGQAAHSLARIGLANYFAGALLLPYASFLRAAEALQYDIERLAQRYGVGFETVCHRLSTLQRPGARGVPFFFIRGDRAGNISKRQSATHFHFSKIGGTCPLWNVYEAFAQPGRIVRQLARMPDGRAYLWIARTVSRSAGGWGAPAKQFSVALGCDVQHAGALVYARGLDVGDASAYVPIGMGCKVCERPACPQRAFPAIGQAGRISEERSSLTPYGM